MLASVDFSRQALDRQYVVKAELSHLLAGFLHLLDAWREVAKFAFAPQNFESMLDSIMRSRQVQKDSIY